MKWKERIGAFHIHTRYSDGSSTMPHIIVAARECEVDFLVISDHDTLAARREGWEGDHDGVEVLVAAEISPRKQGHVVPLHVDQCAGLARTPSDETLDKIAAQGGCTIVAHPQGKHRPMLNIMHKAWYRWQHECIRGLEIWSYTHDWVDAVAWWRFPWTHTVCTFPEKVVRGPEKAILQMWDYLGRARRYTGVGGIDCHAHYIPLADIRLFPYAKMFRCQRNHFFIDAATPREAAADALWEALAEGRGFVAHDILADSRGTVCVGRLPDGSEIMMGEARPFVDGVQFELRLPQPGEIRWVCNGGYRLRETSDFLCATAVTPGVYRFEVWLDGRPWIFANPFYLR